jgi:tetratricopeptide (TPR) repeat protein
MGMNENFNMGEDDEMDTSEPNKESSGSKAFNSTSGSTNASNSSQQTKKDPTKPDLSSLSEEQRQAETEKDMGNDAYKKKEFEKALSHYEKAAELDPTNITYLTNKAGMIKYYCEY